jgi:glycosyltransferase involved in cell wall biosynthesis
MVTLDITRILNRVNEKSPTGIDRVELEYAKHALKCGYFFCYQKGNELFGAPRYLAESAITYLDNRWETGSEETPEVEASISAWKKTLRGNPAPKPSATVKFLKDIQGKPYKDRLALVKKEHEFIKKAAPKVPLSLASWFVAKFPAFLLKKFEPKEKAVPAAGVHWNNIFENVWYLNVGHTGLEKKNLFKFLKDSPNIKVALYLHDLLPMTHPHLFVEGTDKTHKVRMDNMSKYSDTIIANSYYTKQKFEELYGKDTVEVVLEIGSQQDEEEAKPASKAIKRSGFVSLGTVEPRKNYVWLAQAWDDFCNQNPEIVKDEKLTIFGKIGWLKPKDLAKLKEITERGNVQIISGASDSVVESTLSNSRAYMTAAEVEGWGMPLAESLGYGTPVIATDVAAHREVTRNIARFFNFNDIEGFNEHVRKFYSDNEYNNILDEINNYTPWSWESHFTRLDEHLTSA